MTITIQDTLGRYWTIIAARAIMGFRWTVYCHSEGTDPAALEMVYPGGSANGWTDDDYDERCVRALLIGLMRMKNASPKPGSKENAAPHGSSCPAKVANGGSSAREDGEDE